MRAPAFTRRGGVAVALALASVVVVGASAQTPVPPTSASSADLAGGAKVYGIFCARCHGIDGSGGTGPPLAKPRLRRAVDQAGILAIVTGGVPGTAMMGAWSLSEREQQDVAAYVLSLGQRQPEPLPGDPLRGRRVYERSGCATCHIIDGEGVGVGPDLSDVGLVRGKAHLREALLDPAAARPERPVPYEPYGYPAYVPVRARPRRAAEVVGVRVNEDTFTIQLRDMAGRLHSFRKADLQQLSVEPQTSVMPSVRGQLGDPQVDDLVAYLMTLRGKP